MRYIGKMCFLDTDNNTAIFGGILSVPKNYFKCELVKIPEHTNTIKFREHECFGNGWRSTEKHTTVINTKIINGYLVIKDGVCIGMAQKTSLHKSSLCELNNFSKDYCKLLNINYEEH